MIIMMYKLAYCILSYHVNIPVHMICYILWENFFPANKNQRTVEIDTLWLSKRMKQLGIRCLSQKWLLDCSLYLRRGDTICHHKKGLRTHHHTFV